MGGYWPMVGMGVDWPLGTHGYTHAVPYLPHWKFQVITAMMSPWGTWSKLYAEDTTIQQALYSVWISAKHLWRFNVMTFACVHYFPSLSLCFSSFTPLYHYATKYPTGRPHRCTTDKKFGLSLVTRKAVELIWWPWDANPALFQCLSIHTLRLGIQTL